MADSHTGKCQRAGGSRPQRRAAITAVFCVVLAIAGISSCRRDAPPAKSTETHPAKVAQTQPELTQAQDEQSCKAFVQEFYDWYVVQSAKDEEARMGGPAGSMVLRLRPQVLSPELARRLREDNEAQEKADEIVGLEFDPFSGSQDTSPKFRVKAANIVNGHCAATVYGIQEGTIQETVMPELVRENGRWVFINFHYYNPSDSGVLGQLAVLAVDRKKDTK